MQIWLPVLLSVSTCFKLDFNLPCQVERPPFVFNPTCLSEDIVLLNEVYASSNTRRGVYQIVNYQQSTELEETDVDDEEEEEDEEIVYQDHLSLFVYPTHLDSCTGECGIIQRIDVAGKLQTPQLYTNKANQLHLLMYGYGTGKVLTFDRKLKEYIWQEIIVSFSEDNIRICVNSIFDSHCHIFSEAMYEYSPNGPWIIGGSHHKRGMPGFISDVKLIPRDSHLSVLHNDMRFVSKKLSRQFVSPITLPVATMFYLCKAYEIDKMTNTLKLTDKHIQCENNAYIRHDTCDASLGGVIHKVIVRRTVLETGLIHGVLTQHFNCSSDNDIKRWLTTRISKMKQQSLSEDLKRLGTKLLLTSSEHCKGLALLLLSSCHGNPDTIFSIAAFLKTGVVLQKNEKLARELTMIAATQQSVLANLALAAETDKCPVKVAYYGVVAENFMSAWKKGISHDLIADRIRLQYGELGQHTGEDDQVFQFLLMQAQQGDPEAQANVGRMYYWGQGGVERNVEEAFNMQHAAALQQHPDAMFDTGIMLMKGQGIHPNITKARGYLEKSAKLGHKGALGTLGYIELNENDNITGAVHYFNQSHHLGDTDATHNLAIIQTFYSTFDPDPLYAYTMFKLAAERGHKEAAMMATDHALQGFHNKTGDCKMGLKYIKMLSDNSDIVTRRMRDGSKTYQAGNYDQAALQYLILAEAGVETAAYNLAWLCQEFHDQVTYKIPDCATRYYNISAHGGYGPSQAYMGNVLWLKGDVYTSARWFAKAAGNEVPEGLYGLGSFAKMGVAVGVVTVNKTQYYLGPEPNITLANHFWTKCFYMDSADSLVGCGIPIVWLHVSGFTPATLLLVAAAYAGCVVLLAFIIRRLTNITSHEENVQNGGE